MAIISYIPAIASAAGRKKAPTIKTRAVSSTDFTPITLHAKTRTGQVKWYEVSVVHKKDHSIIVRRKAIGEHGTVQTDRTEIWQGTNQGKANEKTIREQAVFDAESLVKRLYDQGYKYFGNKAFFKIEKELSDVVHNTDAQGKVKPMLAQLYSRDRVKFPCYVQPKFNGVRCLAERFEKIVVLRSRKGKIYRVPHISEALFPLMEVGDIFDGELYIHGKHLQKGISAIKNSKNPEHSKVCFVMYDMIKEKTTFEYRLYHLISKTSKIPIFPQIFSGLSRSPSTVVKNEAAIISLHKKFTEHKFEGAMIRNMSGYYEPGYRSYDLLKYKSTIDKEFKIVGYEEATGRMKGCIIFRCQTPQKKGGRFGDGTFTVLPEGSVPYKRSLWKKRTKLVGKKLTVRFNEYSVDMIPINPVGVAIRDYE